MRVTISQDSSTVTVDGVTHEVDCSELPTFIHVIQWDSDRGRGHIELDPDDRGTRMGNLPIVSFDQFQFLVERWRIAGTLKAREETQAKVDQVVHMIATAEQAQAHNAAYQASVTAFQAERARLAEKAEREQQKLDQHDADLNQLKLRLGELERQLKEKATKP